MDFPETMVADAIRDEIEVAAQERPPTKSGWRPEVDSPVVVRVVLRVERELGITLTEDAMPPGGFENVEHCVQSILAQCRDIWREKQKQEGEHVS
jgi:acyl carrier protein